MIRSLKETHTSLQKIQKFLGDSLPSISLIDKDRYHSVLFSLPQYQDMLIREDDDGVIIAMASIFIETRITHGGANVCHAHDLVVKENDLDSKKAMIDYISLYAKKHNCKEVIWISDVALETSLDNAPLEASDKKVMKVRISN